LGSFWPNKVRVQVHWSSCFRIQNSSFVAAYYWQCCGSGMYIPDPNFFPSRIPDPGFLSQKKVSKFSEIWSEMGIPDPDLTIIFYPSWIHRSKRPRIRIRNTDYWLLINIILLGRRAAHDDPLHLNVSVSCCQFPHSASGTVLSPNKQIKKTVSELVLVASYTSLPPTPNWGGSVLYASCRYGTVFFKNNIYAVILFFLTVLAVSTDFL
jgi:hypothetical protein